MSDFGVGQFAGQREHQGKGMFGAGDVGAAAYTQHLDPALFAGDHVDITKQHSIFVNGFKTWRQSKFFSADSQRLNDDRFGGPEVLVQLILGFHQFDAAWIKRTRGLLDFVAPGAEIRQVGRHEIRERGPSFTARRRIENDAYQARPDIVFDNYCWLVLRH